MRHSYSGGVLPVNIIVTGYKWVRVTLARVLKTASGSVVLASIPAPRTMGVHE